MSPLKLITSGDEFSIQDVDDNDISNTPGSDAQQDSQELESWSSDSFCIASHVALDIQHFFVTINGSGATGSAQHLKVCKLCM